MKDGALLFEDDAQTSPVDFFTNAYKQFAYDYPRFYKMDQLAKLGWLTSEVLLTGTFEAGRYQPEEVGLVLFNANASLDTDIKYQDTINGLPSPAVFVYTLPNIVIGEISIRNQFKGDSAFFVDEKPDINFMHQYVSILMNENALQCCICGWVDTLGAAYDAFMVLVEKKTSRLVFDTSTLETLFQTEKSTS